jgi:hypothetical protein
MTKTNTTHALSLSPSVCTKGNARFTTLLAVAITHLHTLTEHTPCTATTPLGVSNTRLAAADAQTCPVLTPQ